MIHLIIETQEETGGAFNGIIFTRNPRLVTIFFFWPTYRYSRSEFARRRLLMLIVCAPRETALCIEMRSPRLITNPSGNDHDTERTQWMLVPREIGHLWYGHRYIKKSKKSLCSSFERGNNILDYFMWPFLSVCHWYSKILKGNSK